MADIQWCIETPNTNQVKNHSDNIPGADKIDDRYGKLSGVEEDYNQVVHLLCKRVSDPKYQNETYAASFYDGEKLVFQSNIGCKTISSIHKIVK